MKVGFVHIKVRVRLGNVKVGSRSVRVKVRIRFGYEG